MEKGQAAASRRSAVYSYSYDGPPFTACVVVRVAMPEGTVEKRGTMRMRPGAWRMEIHHPGVPDVVTIYREDKGLSWMLYPHARTYMESVRLAPVLTFSGRETLNGVLVRKYRYEQEPFRGWEWRDARGIPLRRELQYPCGKATCKMTMRLADIQVKPSLDDALFEIPGGYTPMASPMGVFR